MTIHVILFGHFKEIFPQGKTDILLPDGATPEMVAIHLAENEPRLANLLTRTRVAVQGEFAGSDTALHDGDEVAFLPPMSGG